MPNFKKGKTEAIILYNGAGSQEVQKHIKIDFDSVVPGRVRSAGKNITIDMRCVDFYKHLGTQDSSLRSITPLIKTRVAATRGVFSALKKAIFKYPISLRTKMTFAKIYIFSKLLFDAGTWPKTNKSEAGVLHAHVMRIYRFFFHDVFVDRVSDLDFPMDHQFMSPASILRMLRMSLYVRLISKGHNDILSALFLAHKRERSFISALQADLRFLADIGGVFEEFRGKSMADWTT